MAEADADGTGRLRTGLRTDGHSLAGANGVRGDVRGDGRRYPAYGGGLLSRLAAVVLTIDLTVALLPVKVDVGPIAPHGDGAELDLNLIAGLLVILLACPHTLYELTTL